MKRKFLVFPVFGFFAFIMGAVPKQAVLVNASNTIEITGKAALCNNGDNYGINDFSFTLFEQDKISTKAGAMFTLENNETVILSRGGNTYYPISGSEDSLLEKCTIYSGIDAFKFHFSSALFDGTDAKDGDILTFDNAKFVRADSVEGVNNIVNITKTVFTYKENEGWSSDNGVVGDQITITTESIGTTPGSYNLRFKANVMPEGLQPLGQDFREYIPADEQSGIYVNNVYQTYNIANNGGMFFTYLPGGIFYTAGVPLIYTGKTSRNLFNKGDIIEIKGKFQLLLKNSSTRIKENSYIEFKPIFFEVYENSSSELHFKSITPSATYEAECLGAVINNQFSYWFDLTANPIPDNTTLIVPSSGITLVRGEERMHPSNDTVASGTFIKNRPNTTNGYFFAFQNSWFGGQARTPQEGDKLYIGGDFLYKSPEGLVVLRIKEFVSCYDSSNKWHAGHKTTITATWAEDNSSVTFSGSDCEVCGEHIDDVVVVPSSEDTPATCTEPKKVGYIAHALVAGVLRTDSKQVSVGEPLNHDFKATSYVWDEDYLKCVGTKTCQREGCGHIDTEEASISFEVITEPKCLEEGLGKYIASFTDKDFETQEKEVVIEATGHEFSSNTWHWAEDYSSAYVDMHCANCEEGERKDALVSSGITQEQSCTKPEITTYCATVQFEGKTYIDSKMVETKSPKGHTYDTGTWAWDDDYLAATLTATCVHGDHTLIKNVDATISRIEPTYEKEGQITYTVAYTVNGKTFSDSRNKVIPKLEQPTKSSGCGGEIITSCGIIALLSSLGIGLLLLKKRKKEQ